MRYILLFFFLVSNCQQDGVVEDTPKPTVQISDINFDKSSVQLEGSAANKALGWNEYQSFVTGMENYDHSLAATIQLQEAVDEMIANPNPEFINLPIISRIKVLQTRLGVYSSFLNYNQKTKEDYLLKYNQVVTAWDELKTQMNVKFNEVDRTKQELIEQLRREKRQDEKLKKKDSLKQS